MDILKYFLLLMILVFTCWILAKFITWITDGGITVTVNNGVKISTDYEDINLPCRAHKSDAGYDLFATKDIYIRPRGKATADTGVHIEIPAGYFGDIRPKSGLLFNHDILTAGTVDSGYTGAIRVRIINLGDEPYIFRKNEKIAQMVLVPCLTPDLVVVDKLTETERGNGGFGSTGK